MPCKLRWQDRSDTPVRDCKRDTPGANRWMTLAACKEEQVRRALYLCSTRRTIRHTCRERSVKLRRDARLHFERGAGPAFAGPRRPARWDRVLTQGWQLLSISTITSGAVHRLLRDSADGRRDNWGGPTRPDWQTEPLDGSQLNSTAGRLFWARRRQRKVLFDSPRDTGRNRT
jgi:hypothetical protein